MFKFFRFIVQRIRERPLPPLLLQIYFMLRWGARVTLGADILYPFHVRVGKGTLIGKCKFIASGKGIVLGERCEIGDGCILNSQSGHIALGNHSAIGPYVVIYGEGGVEIGDFCAVATHTTIVAMNHRFDDITQPIRLQGLNAKGIEIASDVWIGANCVVLDGVQISHKSVIAAGAVVTKSVPPLSLAAGVPARVIRVIGQR